MSICSNVQISLPDSASCENFKGVLAIVRSLKEKMYLVLPISLHRLMIHSFMLLIYLEGNSLLEC